MSRFTLLKDSKSLQVKRRREVMEAAAQLKKAAGCTRLTENRELPLPQRELRLLAANTQSLASKINLM